jgi:hypothetical protein
MSDMRELIDTWSEDKLKSDRFIELVKRYTDFSELTTSMLNEFIEKVVVHEGDKRGSDRRQRVDIHLNFIGTFAVPAEIVTPMEVEERRRYEEEQAERERRSKELEQARYERRLQEKREFTARKKAGLLTPEEIEEDERRREHNRAWQKEWREKRQADMPPKPPKPSSKQAVIKEIVARKKEGLPLTPEEIEIYTAHREKENEKFRKRRAKIKANTPPKPPKAKKPTKKEIINDIITRKNAGLLLTPDETEHYDLYRQEKRDKHRIWRDAQAVGNPESLVIADIQKRMRDSLPLTPEQAAFHADWKAQKNEQRREYYHTKKAELAATVNQ